MATHAARVGGKRDRPVNTRFQQPFRNEGGHVQRDAAGRGARVGD